MEEKKKRKNTVIKFFIIILISAFIGAMMGEFVEKNSESVLSIGYIFETGLKYVVFTVMPILIILAPLIPFIICNKVKKQLKKAGDNDEQLDEIEKKLDIAMTICNMSVIFLIIFFGISVYYIKRQENKSVLLVIGLIFSAGLILSIILIPFLQRQIVDIVKKIEPNKKGDVLDINFNKEWMNSCDELEKMIIYRSAYKSYKILNYAHSLGFTFVLLLSIKFDIGLLPMIIVGFFWILHQGVYHQEAKKLSKQKK